MAKRARAEKSQHDKAVQDIATARFRFPNKDHPNWQTSVNEPEPTKGVQTSDDSVLYPDIVVDDDKHAVQMIGEVESESTVNDDEVAQWRDYSALGTTFYLYVPSGLCQEAKALAQGVSITGFREYLYTRDGSLKVSNC
jgi:hypothetical protein